MGMGWDPPQQMDRWMLVMDGFTTSNAGREGKMGCSVCGEVLQFNKCTPNPLLACSFPADPPKGKGNRLAASSGTVMIIPVQLCGIVLQYKQLWAVQHGRLCNLINPHGCDGAASSEDG